MVTGAELVHATNPPSRIRIGWQQRLITIWVCGEATAQVCGTRAVHPCARPAFPRHPREVVGQ